MEFGEFTIVDIILTAFSGIGVFIISWFGVSRYRNKIIQKNIVAGGDVVAGNVIKNPRNDSE